MRFTKRNLASLLLISLPSVSVFLQELHVYYNLFNDSVTYMRDGKILDEPKLRKGMDLQLHLTEFNNFLYEIELEVEQEEISDAGAGGLMQFSQFGGQPPLYDGIGGEKGGSSGGLGIVDVPLLTLNEHPITLRSLFAGSRGSADMLDQAASTMKDITVIVEDVKGLMSEIEKFDEAVFVSKMAMENVKRWKTHPNIKPSDIKRIGTEYYAAVFRKSPGEAISLNDLLKWREAPGQHGLLFQRLNSKSKDLSAKVALFGLITSQLASLDFDDAEFKKYAQELRTFQNETQEFDEKLKDALAMDRGIPDFPTNQELTELQFELAELVSNDFTYHSKIQVTEDIVHINFKLLNKQNQPGEDREVIKSNNLQFQARGGMKVSASLGMSFGQFFSPSQSFSVRENQIVSENEGAFSPAPTSFIHFYSYTGGKVTLGGSFGIGFPLLSPDDNQSLQFYFGPSLILGTRQRMVINAGLMGGRAGRLSRGYQEGDFFDISNGDIPTRHPYELGIFLGTSFNFN